MSVSAHIDKAQNRPAWHYIKPAVLKPEAGDRWTWQEVGTTNYL
jgi:hypothetical protein